jgi:hypothetical protein
MIDGQNEKTSSVRDRAFRAINLAQFSELNFPDEVGFFDIQCPYESQKVLRCLVRELNSDFKIPDELLWLSDAIHFAENHQLNTLGVRHPFCYVTVRHGLTTYTTDDEFHSDGFSMNVTHLPEQNYVWTNVEPTEYVTRRFDFPETFDPKTHNVQLFFQDNIDEQTELKVCKEKTFYIFDPYIVHRRPPKTSGMHRTFIRISFTPIEIADVDNTHNPLLPRHYSRSGVRDVRNKLLRYLP